MPRIYGKKVSRKTYRRRRRVGTKVRAKPSKSFVKKVRQVLHKQVETKHAYHTTANSSMIFFNSGINSTSEMYQILPSISQGTADNARIGDQIRAQSLNMKGYIKLDINSSGISNSDLCAVVARLFVVSLKTKPNYTEAISSSTPLSGLLKKGGTTTGFSGVLSDIYAPVNTDLWTVHADRKFYLNQSHIQNYNSTTNAIVPVDIKNTVKFFNINVRCKNKVLKYDNNISSGTLPTNYGPIFLIGYSFLNGASPDTLSTRLGVQYDAMFSYEDA